MCTLCMLQDGWWGGQGGYDMYQEQQYSSAYGMPLLAAPRTPALLDEFRLHILHFRAETCSRSSMCACTV